LDDGALYIEGENLTERQIIILELLRHRGPLTVTLIGAHFASVSLGIISKEINRLWRGDFVSKEIRREDQRTFIVDLTDKGRRIIDSVRRQRSKEIVTLLQAMAISEEERKLFSNVLNRINSQLEKNLVERI
jgi:DNA-binding MarR family transcriptional regulator